MRRVEQQVIEQSHPQFRVIDEMALASKNLWNLANYHVRQSFLFQQQYLNNTAIFHVVKQTDAYTLLPAKVANQVLLQLHQAWTAKFLELLTYKAEALGIRVIVTEESYTSKASFLDLDPLPTYDPTQGAEQEDKPHFSGSRSGRWYRVKGRAPMHADVNGSFNIGRKVFATAFGPGIEATAVRPRRLAV
jgi:transposase